MKILIAIIVIIVLWSVWGFFASRVEQAEYTVISKADGYEVRLYPAHLVAQTTVTGPYDTALSEGFRIIAGYIFGGNTAQVPIAMTAPVLEGSVDTDTTSTPIAMTAPVLAGIDGESHTISFGMPRSYTRDTLPIPNDSRVTIVEVPERMMAVKRFSWWRSTSRIQSKKDQLLNALKKDSLIPVGSPYYAGYNGPGTPPWMVRHEVLVEIPILSSKNLNKSQN
jgi:hypothetical protein